MNETPFDDVDMPEIKKSPKKIREEQGFFIGKHGYRNSILNVANLIEEDENLKGLWCFNELVGDIEYARSPKWNERIKAGKGINDGDIIFLKGWLASQHRFEPPTLMLREGLFLYASKNSYHPIKKYLEALKWDNKERLNKWLAKVIGSENDAYLSAVGRKFICSMVARIFHPGTQMDYMIIFEGKEGIYKTTMLKILGGEWYAPFVGVTHANFEKDAVDLMRGKWLLELAELAAVRKIEDFERIKAFISCTKDRVRLSYRRDAEDFERQCVLIGTMNPVGDNQYFRDSGENRRFWPVECAEHINIGWLKEHRDQLFAEAMSIWSKERLYLDENDAIKIAIKKQEERKPDDAWDDIIATWLMGKDSATPVQLLTECLGFSKDKIQRTHMTRVGICMKKIHWEIRQFGGNHKKYYVRPGLDMNTLAKQTQELWEEEE